MLLFTEHIPLFVYSSVCHFLDMLCTCYISSFTFHTITYQLEQYNSSGASAIVNAQTIMDIRWLCQLKAQRDGPKFERTLFLFYAYFTLPGRIFFSFYFFIYFLLFVVCCLFCFVLLCFYTITTIQGNIARQYCPQQGWDCQLRQNQCLQHSGL